MKIREMELLVRVAETGSMTQAARQLHLTPAAVSATVQRIEGALGLRLFERTTRSLHPTDEGVVVLEGCEAVLERWGRTLDELRARPELEGTVRLSAPSDTSYELLAGLLADFSRQHPRLRIELSVSDSLEHLHRQALDMAIRYGRLEDSGLAARKLAEQPTILVASPDWLAEHGTPSRPEELQGHRCLSLRAAGSPERAWTLSRGEERWTQPLESPLCGDGHLARRWALAGEGLALKSLFDVIGDLETGALRRLLPDWQGPTSPIHALFPSRRYQAARVRALSEALVQAFAERSARCEAWLSSRG